MIQIIPAPKGGGDTPTPAQQLKIVSNDDSIKVLTRDEYEDERNIERFNYLAAEDIDSGAACYFNFVEEDNEGATAKNMVEYTINTKGGRRIDFTMICPYTLTSVSDFQIQIKGDVLEDDGFYIELYEDPGDGEGNRYQGYLGVIYFYSASYNASGGDPNEQFFVQVAGDKTNINWLWLGLTLEAYQRLELVEDYGYYMRDFWVDEPETGFEGLNLIEVNDNDFIEPLNFNIIRLKKSSQKFNNPSFYLYSSEGIILKESSVDDHFSSIGIPFTESFIGTLKDVIDKYVLNNLANTSFMFDFKLIDTNILLTKYSGEFNYLSFKFSENTTNRNLYYSIDIFNFHPNIPDQHAQELNIKISKDAIFSTDPIITFWATGNIVPQWSYQIQNLCVKAIDIPQDVYILGYNLFFNWKILESIDLSNYKFYRQPRNPYMFKNCYAITSINLSGCDLSFFTEIIDFCADCTALEEIDLSGCNLSYFRTANANKYSNIFLNCNALTTIKAIGCDADTIAFLESVKPAGATVVTA